MDHPPTWLTPHSSMTPRSWGVSAVWLIQRGFWTPSFMAGYSHFGKTTPSPFTSHTIVRITWLLGKAFLARFGSEVREHQVNRWKKINAAWRRYRIRLELEQPDDNSNLSTLLNLHHLTKIPRIDWLTNWQTVCPMVWVTEWQIDWLTDRFEIWKALV